jgi:hypothetical protein
MNKEEFLTVLGWLFLFLGWFAIIYQLLVDPKSIVPMLFFFTALTCFMLSLLIGYNRLLIRKHPVSVKACMDLLMPEHNHYSHKAGTVYRCPKGCILRWDNICQIITHLEDHLRDGF